MPFASFSGGSVGTAPPVSDRALAGLAPRLVSALVLAAVALVAVGAGAMAFDALVAVAAAVLAWEWTRLCGEGRFGATGTLMAVIVVATVALASSGQPAFALALSVAGAAAVRTLAGWRGRANALWIAAGPLYIGIPSVALVWLRADDAAGRTLILWLLVTVWATDIGAYVAGRLIGGPRLAPQVSPNKTWAGLLGAMVSAGVVGVIAAQIDPLGPTAVLLAFAGAVVAVVAQAGDLGESWVKRRFGAKDASHLIPGHGGLFDRVDGLLAAATVLAMWQWSTGGGLLQWR